MLTSERKKPKRSKIRYAEYYDLQKTLDSLYADSLKGKVFVHLMELISSEENIRMAYRTIKGNTGSSTAGVDKRTIQDLAKLNEEKYVALIQKQFKSYHPRPVRRVEIPKPNGKTRPLGIPTIVDRIVQQCVLQVLEPICEAKFYDHSYGFRPNRSTEHAIARCDQLIQLSHLYYVVDIDTLGVLCVLLKRWTAACQSGYPAILFVPRKSSEINPNSSPILIVPFPTFPGKAIHSGSQSEAGHRSLLMLFLVILRLVDIFPTIW